MADILYLRCSEKVLVEEPFKEIAKASMYVHALQNYAKNKGEPVCPHVDLSQLVGVSIVPEHVVRELMHLCREAEYSITLHLPEDIAMLLALANVLLCVPNVITRIISHVCDFLTIYSDDYDEDVLKIDVIQGIDDDDTEGDQQAIDLVRHLTKLPFLVNDDDDDENLWADVILAMERATKRYVLVNTMRDIQFMSPREIISEYSL